MHTCVCAARSRMRLKVLGFALAAALVGMLSGCGATGSSSPTPSDVVAQDAAKWDIEFSEAMPLHPGSTDQAAWSFDFPQSPGSVHYVTVPYSHTASHSSVTMRFRVESDGAVTYNGNLTPDNTCQDPAHVRLYFQKQNDDMTSDGNRWWAHAVAYQLGSADGTTLEMTVPLTPDQW